MKFKLVKKITEAKDTVSLYFISNIKFTWQTGQYAYLTLGEITKQFTIASSTTEDFIQITTRIREGSEFKQKLDKLEIGSEIEARAPFGSFVFDENIKNNVFLAGGIGITPFRSMLKYNIDSKLNLPMFLIYSNSNSEFVFKNELDNWQKENDFLKIIYYDSSVSDHLDAKKLLALLPTSYILHPTFYVVGPPTFVNAMEDALNELKIPEDQIKTEKFIGY